MTPNVLLRHPFSFSIVVAFILLLADALVIYPRFRSPLRNIPQTTGRENGRIIFESPRGKSALRWIREQPDAELIRIKNAFGLPTILCSGPDALRDILNTHVYDFEKSWGVRAFLARAIGWGLILSEGAEHTRQKKVLTPAFHIRRIRELYSLMWEKTQILQSGLEADIKDHPIGSGGFGLVELSEWSSRLTLDIIGPAAMGRDFQSLTTEENPIADAFLEMLRPDRSRLAFLGLHFIIPESIVRRLPLKTNETLNRIGTFLRHTCYDIIQEKNRELMEKGTGLAEYDILSRIVQTGEFTDAEIVDQMLTFLAAGHETTASALTWACYLCAKYPEVQQKLRAEIHENIPSSTTTITWDILESMSYLNGVCEETLRLYPTVPATIREAVRTTQVAGYTIPKGTDFILVPYAINRHPRFWGDNADMIVPERWIDTLPDGTTRPNKTGGTTTNFSELTFLHGPRACIGRDFAKAELRCAVAGVIGKFEIELCTLEEPKVTGVITMKAEGGMYLRLRPIESW
ncbi:cytochrome P450 [Pseudomassariella vexata]|uniref:Cytochrome P450 n=1 Tax=Pseudomassariella vexata TaxID=1141098 RepID=A0A1Y2EBN7_9PEZI|nr:cytochrome P450 [Pseudomassariella vexata]ORY68971.1 cytochrome P450 [Pseudomassariella vexata]